ncbi:MAG: hypothetical protein ACRCZP_01885, partial [Phycicoccus sp.]
SDDMPAAPPHPAMRALMQFLRLSQPEAVFHWSDTSPDDHTVVQGLRGCAAQVRAQAPGAAS